jgi:hypothetical protein
MAESTRLSTMAESTWPEELFTTAEKELLAMVESTQVSSTTYVAPDGDLIVTFTDVSKFALNTDATVEAVLKSKRRVRVDSHTISAFSPVFRTMLGPNFREGQRQGTAENPKEIEFPDDDHVAMSILCHMLHLKPCEHLLRHQPYIDLAKRVLQLAMLADK